MQLAIEDLDNLSMQVMRLINFLSICSLKPLGFEPPGWNTNAEATIPPKDLLGLGILITLCN